MIEYIEAPSSALGKHRNRLFLAGGITGCPDWQADVVNELTMAGVDELTVYNPRRKDFPIHDPTAAAAQIAWEYAKLGRASSVLFWFPCETLCPIVLYELGAQSKQFKPIFVGCHPDYQRKQDVIIQLQLARPGVEVVFSTKELVEKVKQWADD